jgi:transcription initiation factor IIE alpha subunit
MRRKAGIPQKSCPRAFEVVKMILYRLTDEEISDYLCQTATTIERALHFVRVLADGLVQFPSDCDARTQIIESGLTIQAALAGELDSMRRILEDHDNGPVIPKVGQFN